MTEDLTGFWLIWHLHGGFDGLTEIRTAPDSLAAGRAGAAADNRVRAAGTRG